MIGARVPVQWDEQYVRILDPRSRKLLREHLVQTPGRYRTPEQDKPSRTPKSTEQLLARATNAGRHVGILCAEIHRADGEIGVRRLLGVLSLAKKYGAPTELPPLPSGHSSLLSLTFKDFESEGGWRDEFKSATQCDGAGRASRTLPGIAPQFCEPSDC